MFRNSEFVAFSAIMAVVYVAGTAAGFAVQKSAGICVLLVGGALFLAFFLFTAWRYREIAKLCRYLASICRGDYLLDVRDNVEGELSILKNDIYKVTLMLKEKSELLQKDKLNLANALSDISHQLKTPLTSMVVMTDLLADENLNAEKREEFNRRMKAQLGRIEWLVSSLLKLSKIDAGTVRFKKEAIPAGDLIDRFTAPLLIPIELKGQTLRLDGDREQLIFCDLNWTSEAFVNILKNCMEHTQEGGSIAVTYTNNPLYAQIQIADNGSGIAKEDLPHIFERFYKGKNAGPDSVGLGLAMSQAILEQQGARIHVESELARGTAFTIRFYKQIV